MKAKKNRALAASLMINLCIGSIYAWSVFAGPLSSANGWSPEGTALTFTIANAVGPITMIAGGKLQDKYGPRWVIFAGALLFGMGMIASGFAHELYMIYITYGLMVGLGLGTIYSCTIANTVKLFPEKKGLIAGVTTCVYGLSTVIVAPLAQWLISQYGVSKTFVILGVAFIVIVSVCSKFVIKAEIPDVEIPDAAKEAEDLTGTNQAKTSAGAGVVNGPAGAGKSNDLTWKQMLRKPIFYILLIVLSFGATSGLMIISQASAMAQEIVKVTPQTAAIGVSVIAISNALGRIIWGRISDGAGRYRSLAMMFCVLAISMLLLTGVSEGQWAGFLLLTMLIAFCFGGFMGVYPAVTAESFGIRNNGVNYGFMFIGFALGGFMGPRFATMFRVSGMGLYGKAFLIAAAMAVAGIMIMAVLLIRERAAGKR